jgi:diguanylate cyclase (GGDEF)-like protein
LNSQLEWANRLYCGGELKHLLTACSYQLDAEQKGQQDPLRQLCLAVKAAAYLGHGEECSRLLSNLENTDWRQSDNDTRYLIFISRFQAYTWFHQFKDALIVANEFCSWSETTENNAYQAHALTVQFYAQCMNGIFHHNAEEHHYLESLLEKLMWPSFLHFVRSSYWFDHHYTLHAGSDLIEHCNRALQYANEEENLHALTRALHYKGIVHQHHGRFDQALMCLDPSIEKSYALENTRRTYYALNGKAYLLMQLTEFEQALSAVEKAFQLVLQDNNHEQICTTLCNAALTALFAEHYSCAIKSIDEVFSTMLIRGIPNTRFRSNHELRAIQSIAALFASDRQFALAIFKVSEPEQAKTVEGRYMQSIMGVIERFDALNNDEIHEAFYLCFEQAQEFRIPLLALFVLKVQHHLMLQETNRFGKENVQTLRAAAIRYANEASLTHCLHWFDDSAEEKTNLASRFNKLTATKISQREAQIDLLRIENALLTIALDMETHASRCSVPDDLFEFCIDKLYKSISLESINIVVEHDGELTYQNKIGLNHPDRQPHEFVFYCDQRKVVFTIQFDAKAEVFTDQLMNWTTRFLDQLESAVSKIVERNRTRALVHIDHLTGLKNRAAFDAFFAQTELMAGDCLSVAYIDLNNFKTINDQHGHLTGDAILTAFAGHLAHSVRSTDDIFRIGGDEFFIVFHQTRAAHVEQTLEQKLMAFFTRPRRKDDPHAELYRTLGCSVGLLEIRSENKTVLDKITIVELSDKLMYRAKAKLGSHIEKGVIDL